MPVVHICDDACTYVSHCLLRYPIEAELAFGQKRGCFQKPDETKEPQKNISCPDITPIELDPRKPNREAMRNQSILVHPDVTHQTRYVLGTRYIYINQKGYCMPCISRGCCPRYYASSFVQT